MLGALGRPLGFLGLVQARPQHPVGLGAVLVLGLLVLARDHQAGRHVRQAHRGVGGVDALPARARRPVHVDADVLRADLHLRLRHLREHRNGHRRGVDAALRLGHRYALHAVHAALPAQVVEHVGAGDRERQLAETADLGRAGGDHLHLPAPGVRIAAVHPVQVGGEQRRLAAAGAGTDLHDDVARRVGVTRHQQLPRPFHRLGQALLELADFFVRELPHRVVVLGGGHLVRLLDLNGQTADLIALAHHGRQLRVLLHQLAIGALVPGLGRIRGQRLQRAIARGRFVQARAQRRIDCTHGVVSGRYPTFPPRGRGRDKVTA